MARARHWAETGVEAELRRRGGEDGPVRRERVMDRGEYAWCTWLAQGTDAGAAVVRSDQSLSMAVRSMSMA